MNIRTILIGVCMAIGITRPIYAAISQCTDTICDTSLWGQCPGADTCTYQKFTGTGIDTCDGMPTCGCYKGVYVFGSGCFCESGTYGNAVTCTACPSPGTSIAGHNTSINDCFIPSGSSFSDSIGSGSYTSACHY